MVCTTAWSGLAKVGAHVPTLSKSTWFNTTADQELPDHGRDKDLKIFRELLRSPESGLPRQASLLPFIIATLLYVIHKPLMVPVNS